MNNSNRFYVVKVVAWLFLLVFLNACNFNQESKVKFRILSVNGDYSFEIPSYLRIQEPTRNYVLLHYQNLMQEVFLEIEENDLNQYIDRNITDLDMAFTLAKALYRNSQAGPVQINNKTVKRKLLPNQSLANISKGAEFFLQEIDNKANYQRSIVLSSMYKLDDKMIILTLVTNEYFREKHLPVFEHIIRSYKCIEVENLSLAF